MKYVNSQKALHHKKRIMIILEMSKCAQVIIWTGLVIYFFSKINKTDLCTTLYIVQWLILLQQYMTVSPDGSNWLVLSWT